MPRHTAKAALLEKGVKDHKHYCAICDQIFIRKAGLTKHLAGPMHAAKAALLEKAKEMRYDLPPDIKLLA